MGHQTVSIRWITLLVVPELGVALTAAGESPRRDLPAIRIAAGMPTGQAQEDAVHGIHSGAWLDVRVVVRNPAGHGQLAGTLELTGRINEDTPLGPVRTSLALPANSTRRFRFTLFLPAGPYTFRDVAELSAVLQDAGGRQLAQEALPGRDDLRLEASTRVALGLDGSVLNVFLLTADGNVSLGYLNDRTLGLAQAAAADTGADGSVLSMNVCRLSDQREQFELLPDTVGGLAGARAIIVQDLAVLDLLSAEQKLALQAWVSSGGVLVLAPTRAGQLDRPFVRGLVALSLGAGRVAMPGWPGTPLAAAAGKPLFAARADRHPGASAYPARALDGRTPAVLWRCPVGRGQVVVLCFDLGTRGWFRSNKIVSAENKQLLFGQIFRDVRGEPIEFEAVSWRGQRTALAVTTGMRGMPSLALVFALVAAYLALIGPANFLWLRRQRRAGLAVGTIPASAIVFTLLVVGLHSRQGPAKTQLRQISVARVHWGGRVATIGTVAALLAGTDGTYHLSCSATGGVRLLDVDGRTFVAYPAVHRPGQELVLAGRMLPMWQVQFAEGRDTVFLAGPIRARLEGKQSLWIGNESDFVIDRAWVCDKDGRARPVPMAVPLGRGQEFTVEFRQLGPATGPPSRRAGSFADAARALACESAARIAGEIPSRCCLLVKLDRAVGQVCAAPCGASRTEPFALIEVASARSVR